MERCELREEGEAEEREEGCGGTSYSKILFVMLCKALLALLFFSQLY